MPLFFFGILLALVSVFLMLIILVQRGKGGGLTGALGGMGGQSAFGAKAGDAFTKITTVTSIIWITLCMLTIALFNPPPRNVTIKKPDATLSAPSDGEESGAGAGPAAVDESGGSDTTPPAEKAAGSEDYEIDLSADETTGQNKPAEKVDQKPDVDGGGAASEADTTKGDGNSDNDSPGDG